MKKSILILILIGMTQPLLANNFQEPDLNQYPCTIISNKNISIKVYLQVLEKEVYQGPRPDWSGIMGSVQNKRNEYFGFWKNIQK
jgi:hypothetical protein